jgi:hypothetical protein
VSTASLLQQNLTEVGLIRILAREDIAPKLFRELPVEDAALMIQRGMHSAGAGRVKYKRVHRAKKSSPNKAAKKSGNKAPPPPNYWRLVKNEVRILVCTGNKKYAGLRKQIQKKGSATQTMLVSNIAIGNRAEARLYSRSHRSVRCDDSARDDPNKY